MVKPTLQTQTPTAIQLLQYAENILVKMTENATLFPTPDPTLADLEAAILVYRKAITDAAFRDTRQITFKNQQQVAMKQVLYELALYVDKTAKGDPYIILAAGFVPTKERDSSGVPPIPREFSVIIVDSGDGQVHLRVKPWKHVRLYRFEYRKLGQDEEWQLVLTSKSKHILTDLEKRQDYEFRVAYLGSDPTVTYSDVIRKYVY